MSDVVRIVDSEVIDYESSPEVLAPPLPAAQVQGADIRIRPGVLSDYPFIDALQKANKQGVGFMWEKAIKGHIEKGNVLVAEADPGSGAPGNIEPRRHEGHEEEVRRSQGPEADGATTDREKAGGEGECIDPVFPPSDASSSSSCASRLRGSTPVPVGYVLGVDRYLKRDELGVIYQMCVAPEYRRSLVAANLLKAKFEASAYGCRLYCCWCAQDLAANRFWEAMGFVPLAFRTGGGRTKKAGPRMHIFWQKRIRPRQWNEQAGVWVEDDYPYWFPSQTGAGAIGEDRIVLPIPPGTHWSDAKPVVLPTSSCDDGETKLLEARVSELEQAKRVLKKKGPGGVRSDGPGAQAGAAGVKKRPSVKRVSSGGLHFGARPKSAAEQEAEALEAEARRGEAEAAQVEAALKEAKQAARRAKKKFDPAQVAFARELKDRWLEQVQAQPGLLAASAEKYAVRRQIAPGSGEHALLQDMEADDLPGVRRLDAA